VNRAGVLPDLQVPYSRRVQMPKAQGPDEGRYRPLSRFQVPAAGSWASRTGSAGPACETINVSFRGNGRYQRNFMLTWPMRPGPAPVTRPKVPLL
jgi:hypothetical protein